LHLQLWHTSFKLVLWLAARFSRAASIRSAARSNRGAQGTLKGLLRRAREGVAFNQHFKTDGDTVYRHACALGCEGIVSKQLGSPYRPGRADVWVKIKNPAAPAVKREAEEEWRK